MNQSPRWERIEAHIDEIGEAYKLASLTDVMESVDPGVIAEIFGSHSLTFMLLEKFEGADRNSVLTWADFYMIKGVLPSFIGSRS
jgi:hypothetical protein